MRRLGVLARFLAATAIASAVPIVLPMAGAAEASTKVTDTGFLVAAIPTGSTHVTSTVTAHDTKRNQFMVAMRAHPDGAFLTPWRMITVVTGANGQAVAPPVLTNTVQALHDEPYHPNYAGYYDDVAYNPVSDEYLLVWSQTTGPNSSVALGGRWGAIFAQHFRASDGAPVGGPLRLTAPPGAISTCGDAEPRIVFNPANGGYTIAWNSGNLQIGTPTATQCPRGADPTGRTTLRVAAMSAAPGVDSLVGVEVPGSRQNETHVNHDLALNSKTGEFMLTWFRPTVSTMGGSIPSSDFAHRLSASGDPVGSPFTIVTPSYGDSEVTADPVTGNWLVVSTSAGDGLLSHLFTSDGTRIGAPVKALTGGSFVQVAAVGDGTYVAMHDGKRLVHLGADGQAKGAPVLAPEGDTFVIGNNGSPVFAVGRGSQGDRFNSMSGSLISLDPGVITATSPSRVLDTRVGEKTSDGQFQGTGVLAGGKEVALTIAGRGNVPTDAAAVVLNVTAVEPAGPGYLTVYPCGTTRPLASNVNYVGGQVVANAVVAKIGTNGKVCIYTSQPTNLLADVNAYVPAGGSPTPLDPSRILDTRAGEKTSDGQFQGEGVLGSGQEVALTVAGRGNVPASASAVVLNVTAVEPAGPGYLTVYPCGTTRPLASNVNYVGGQVVPNAVVAKIGSNGKVCIYTSQPTNLLADVNAYVPAGGSPTPLDPSRILDTRAGEKTSDGQFQGTNVVAGGQEVALTVAGRGNVPANASAVILNVTAVEPAGPGYLTVYPCGTTRPLASNVNYVGGQVVPNAVVAKIGTNGKVCIFTSQTSNLLADVNAYVAGAAAG